MSEKRTFDMHWDYIKKYLILSYAEKQSLITQTDVNSVHFQAVPTDQQSKALIKKVGDLKLQNGNITQSEIRTICAIYNKIPVKYFEENENKLVKTRKKIKQRKTGM
eukprot:292352_1